MTEEKTYYIAINDEERGFGHLIYKNEKFQITEREMINLIKILFVDRRFVTVGRKLMEIYSDSMGYSKEALQKLKDIGLESYNDNGTTKSNADRTL